MKRGSLAMLAICLTSLACKDDPARSVKIVERPAKAVPSQLSASNTAIGSPTPARIQSLPLRIKRAPLHHTVVVNASPKPESHQVEDCPPPAEGSQGLGHLIAHGPCEFEQTAPVSCEDSIDDFYAAFTRPAKNGATLVVYINVENYKGPGDYDGAQMFVAVQSGTRILRWSNDDVHATVGPDEAFLTIPNTKLDAEPMLVDCTRLISPDTNYQYQCSPKTQTETAIESAAEIISGKFICGVVKKLE